MVYRLIFTVLYVLIIEVSTFAQYYKFLTDDNNRHVAQDAIELNSGNLVIPDACWNSQSNQPSTTLFKIDSEGHVLDNKSLLHDDYYYFLPFVENIDGNLLFAGSMANKSDLSYDILLVETDTAFNILWDTIFGSAYNDFIYSMKVNDNGEIYLTYIETLDTIYNWRVCYISPSRQLEDIIDLKSTTVLSSEIIESPDESKLIVSSFWYNRLWIIDRHTFAIDSIIEYISLNLENPSSSLSNYDDSSFIENVYNYKTVIPQNPDISQICIMRRDYDGHILDYFAINSSLDTAEMTSNGCIHVISPDSILILASRGSTIYGHSMYNPYQDSKFSLYNISIDGTINWNKLYGENGFYNCHKLLPSRDGGYYLLGTYFDWRKKSPNYQMVVFKVNDNGDLATSIENHIPEVSNVKMYPNPVSDILSIEIDGDVEIEQLRVLDIQGRIRYESMLHQKSNSIQISMKDFNSGLYFIQLIDAKKSIINKRIIVNH